MLKDDRLSQRFQSEIQPFHIYEMQKDDLMEIHMIFHEPRYQLHGVEQVF